MPPADGPLGLPRDSLRPEAAALLAALAAAGVLVAVHPGLRRRLPASVTAVAAVALAVRALLALAVDGGLYDVFHAYRLVGDTLRTGGDVYSGDALGLANYPPLAYWWWAAATAVPAAHPHLYAALVRAPFWVADAGVAVLLLRAAPPRAAVPAAWLYALSPVAAAVPTLHGQFEPWVLLPLTGAVVLAGRRPAPAGLLLGLAVAVKPWPAFLAVPLLATLPPRAWPRLCAGLVAVPVAAFAVYAAVHPGHLGDGVWRVLSYQAHRQGFGISWLLPDDLSPGGVNALNAGAGLLSLAAGLLAARAGHDRAGVLAIAALVLLTASPTVSDQYLVWPLPLLLLAGRPGATAVLGAVLTPAVAGVDLWLSQGGAAPPAALLALATAATGLTAIAVAVRPTAGAAPSPSVPPALRPEPLLGAPG